MTISYTALLGLAQPVTGTETGQWGTVVNDEITALLEDAVANAASISVTAGNVTLSTTNGSSNQARMSTLIITGTPGTTRNVVAPSQAKIYVVINQSDGAVVIKGAATSGVTIGAGQTAQVAWNGSDFVEIGNYVHGNFVVNGNLSVNGDSTLGNAGADTTTINGQVIAANSNISKTTTLSASAPALAWIKGATYTDTGTAGGTTQALAPFTVFSAPTLSTSNIVTYTNAATVYVAGAPAAAGSATITNPYSLYVAAGDAYFGASVVLNAGTANGVPYLSSPGKVLTTGSALTFDGTKLGVQQQVNIAANASAVTIANGLTLATGYGVSYLNSTDGSGTLKELYQSAAFFAWTPSGGSEVMRLTSTGLKASIAGTNADPVFSYTSDTNTGIFFPAADKLGFTAGGGSDQMVLTSTGLGIGTNNPAYKLHVVNDTAATNTAVDVLALTQSSTGTADSGLGAGILFNSERPTGGAIIKRGAIYGVAGTDPDDDGALTFYTLSDTGPSGFTEKMRLDSSGNLGIGTSSPAVKLTVRSPHAVPTATTYTGGFLIHDEPNGIEPHLGAGVAYNGGDQLSWIQSNSSSGVQTLALNPAGGQVRFGNSAMLLDASGNLGVGVTSIGAIGSSKLVEIGATTGNSAFLLFNINNARTGAMYSNASETSVGSISATPLLLKTGDTEKARISSDGTFRVKGAGTAGTTDAVQFSGSAPASAMTLDALGNLGIGATSPEAKLDVLRQGNTSGGTIMMSGSKTNNSIKYGNLTGAHYNNSTYPQGICGVGILSTSDNNFVDIGGNVGEQIAANTIRFWTAANTTTAGGTERARITSGGYFKASDDGTYINATGSFHEVCQTSSGNYAFRVEHSTATTPLGIQVIYNGAAPNGTGSAFLYCQDNTPATRAEIRSNGGLANYQSNNVDLSDIRTKTDINPLASYWGKIAALEIVTYKYKDQTHDDLNIGVIAQQVEQVAPEFVDADGFGETPEDGVPLKTIYNKDLTFAAIKALQEAMARIEKLEAEVAALKGA